jgi:hypothetical protein
MPEKLTAYGKMTEADTDILNQHIRFLLEMNDQLLDELRAASPTGNSASTEL